jgi:NitT/TauT family transport system substrate-binding protein
MRTPHVIVAALTAMLSMVARRPLRPSRRSTSAPRPSFIFLPLYATEPLGYFKGEGITAQFVDFEGGAEVTTAMVGGSIDMGGTMVERPLILAEKGFGAKNLPALENRNPLHVVVRKDLPAKEVKDLKGRA